MPIHAYNLFNKHHLMMFFFFFQAEDGIRDRNVTGVQTCALPILTAESGCANETVCRSPHRHDAVVGPRRFARSRTASSSAAPAIASRSPASPLARSANQVLDGDPM